MHESLNIQNILLAYSWKKSGFWFVVALVMLRLSYQICLCPIWKLLLPSLEHTFCPTWGWKISTMYSMGKHYCHKIQISVTDIPRAVSSYRCKKSIAVMRRMTRDVHWKMDGVEVRTRLSCVAYGMAEMHVCRKNQVCHKIKLPSK
jgi:hypothetical protein